MSQDMVETKEIELDVKINKNILYDYSLYHTYRSFAGILGTFIGILLIVYYVRMHNPLHLIFGIIVIFYLPVNLYMACTRQMQVTEAYKAPIHYRLHENGIEFSQGEIVQGYEWSKVLKAVGTSKSIFLYTGKNIATILPRADMGDDMLEILAYIHAHVEPSKVKIRF